MEKKNIPEEKERRIIRAAMENFAKNGYKKTAIDEIVADAEISKGLIFHYFSSKKKLYLYLYEFAYGLVYERVTAMFETFADDLFERIRQTERAKLAVVNQYPYMLDFLASARNEKDEQLLAEIGRIKTERFPDWSSSFFSGIDTSKLRDGVKPEKVIKLVLWCTNGLLAEHKDNLVMEEIIAEMDGYLEMMRTAFYKGLINTQGRVCNAADR